MVFSYSRATIVALVLLALEAFPVARSTPWLVTDGLAASLPGRTRAKAGLHTPEKALLTQIRFLSSKSYTRVMLNLTRKTAYEAHRLGGNSSKGLPPRIYIDLRNAGLALRSKNPIDVHDGLLRQVRVGQFRENVVRVVLDLNSPGEPKVFMLPDPYRLVIDVPGQNGAGPLALTTKDKRLSPVSGGHEPPPARVGIRKIVLDPGHGGKDPGAIGIDGLAEKDIVLKVAKKLAAKIRKEMGIKVVLTRTDDRYVALEDRTAMANAEDADLFISLHMNASRNREARGLETYYLDSTNDEAAIRLAERENGTSRNNVSDLQFILSDMTQNMKLEDSITLAHHVQDSLVGLMSGKTHGVRDLGVKKALFYVLVGARMPSVLVEMFFITNKTEGREMAQSRYQDAVVDALYEGVKEYNQSMLAMKTL
ncbi:MAG TPA: N-acetylmuramoyl-L-alanine amidase [Terriglobales bacterium]|nr:N-acetylmuramoyl-L-alanine amidase [Terriglobales bacterium]